MAMIAKLADLKTRLGIAGSAQDNTLTQILKDVGAMFDTHCNRTLLYSASDETEYFDGDVGELLLRRWPIVSITSVKEDDDQDWANATALTLNSDYRRHDPRGRLIRLPDDTRWLAGPNTVQVIYKGGYNDPAEAAIAGVSYVPERIQQAALLQAQFGWERRNQMSQASTSPVGGAGGVVSTQSEYGMLRQVREMLASERRL